MTDVYAAHYHARVSTSFINIYGLEQNYKVDIQFKVMHVMLDTIDLSDRVFLKGESEELVFDSDLRLNDTLYE